VLSRTRRHERFDQVMLQSDAVIVGGQSGGALIDGNGRVLGISGYTYAGVFSFSLSSNDVIEAIGEIRAGHGADRGLVPSEVRDWDEEIQLNFPVRESTRTLLVPAAPQERTVTMSVQAREYTVDVYGLAGEPIASYWQYLDSFDFSDGLDDDGNDWFTEVGDPYGFGAQMEPDDDGYLSFELPADVTARIYVWTSRRGDVDVTCDQPFVVLDDIVTGEPIEPGEPLRADIDALNGTSTHTIELEKGDELTVTVTGAPIIPSVNLLTPDEHPLGFYSDPFGLYGETLLGFLDVPVTRTFTINKSGEFTLVVDAAIATEYILDVTVD
jgi:hypothetical protein